MSWRPQKSCKDKLTTSDGLSIPGEKRHIGHAHLAMIGTSLGDGLFPVKEAGTSLLINENGLVVATDPASMVVAVHDFVAISDGFIIGHKWLDKTKIVATKTLSAADPTNPRIDLIIIATTEDDLGKKVHDNEVVDANVLVVEGTPAAEPETPALEPGQILLAKVNVAAGATEITDAEIIDCRDFLKDIDDDVCRMINNIIQQNQQTNQRIRRRFAVQDQRITDLENAGGGGGLVSVISPVEFVVGTDPNQIATLTGHDTDVFDTEGIVRLPSTPGAIETAFEEKWNPDNPPASFSYQNYGQLVFSPSLVPFGSGDAGGVGAAIPPIGVPMVAEFNTAINGIDEPSMITGKALSASLSLSCSYRLNFDQSAAEGGIQFGGVFSSYQQNTTDGQAVGINVGVNPDNNPGGPIGVYAEFFYFGPTGFNQVAFQRDIGILDGVTLQDFGDRDVTVNVDIDGFGAIASASVTYDAGAGPVTIPLDFDFASLNATPTAGEALLNAEWNNGGFAFGPSTSLAELGLMNNKVDAMGAAAFTGPAVLTTTDVDSADKIITAYLAGDYTAPDGTTVVFEINRGSGFEPITPDVLKSFDGTATSETVVLKVTLDNTNPAFTPTLRGMTFNSDDATRQADLKAFADKYDALVQKLVDGGVATVAVEDKIELA